MAACEKCWEDAKRMHFTQPQRGKDIYDVYRELLEKRKDNPCTPQEQAGQFWDEEKQRDKRLTTLTASHREGKNEKRIWN